MKEKYCLPAILLACLFSYAVYLTAEYYITGGKMGVPLDDTWIHFRFAENFAAGRFFEYNAGEPTAGTTSPLYVVLLAGASFISSDYILNSIFISCLFHLLSCIVAYRLALTVFSSEAAKESIAQLGLTPWQASLLSTLLTVFTGRFLWAGLSGMETTLFAFLTLSSVYSFIALKNEKNEIYITTVLAALATTARPEGLLLTSFISLIRISNSIKVKDLKELFPKLILSAVPFLLIAGPYFWFSYSLTGHIFPNTYKGQGGELQYLPGLNYLRIVCIYFFRDNFITGILFAGGFLYTAKHFRRLFGGEFGNITLLIIWVYGLPLVSSFLVPNWRHHMRYMMPLIPFVSITSVYFLGIFLGSEKLVRLRSFFLKNPARLAIILVFSMLYYGLFAFYIGKNTQNINDQQVALGYWVKENVGRDKTIAVNDIGAITFISKNRVIDMAGLVTPEVLRYRQYNWDDNLDSLNYLLKKNNVEYIIIYDHWFKEYLDRYERNLKFVTSAFLEHNTICGGVEMKVYKTNF